MTKTPAQKKAQKVYELKLRAKGIKLRSLRASDENWEAIKRFAKKLKEIRI